MMRRRAFSLAILLGASGAWTVAEAQRAPDGTAIDIALDTAAGRVILDAVLEEVADHVRRPGRDTVSRAWDVYIPPNAPGWPAFRDRFLRAVRGRAPTDYDDERYSLAIARVRVRGDTLLAEFRTSAAERCEATWPGSGTDYEMRAIRRGQTWELVGTKPIGFSDGWCANAMRVHIEAMLDSTFPGYADSLHENARVRVRSSLLPEGWTVGTVFRNTTPNRCLMVAVDASGVRPLTLGGIGRMQVSTLYFGTPGDRPASVYTAGADTTGERWREVSLPSVAARDSTCRG